MNLNSIKNSSGSKLYNEALKNKETNKVKYHLYLVMAANKGYQLAKDQFYNYYYNELSFLSFKPYPIDIEKAKQFYKYTKNYSYSSMLLGDIYQYDMKNYEKAIQLYQFAIEKDDTCILAYDNLSLMYENGLGVDVDMKIAKKYSQLSQSKQNSYSIFIEAYELAENNKWKQAEKLFKEVIRTGDYYKEKAISELIRKYKRADSYKYIHKYQKEIINYFIEIGRIENLKDIYGYDNNSIEIIKQYSILQKKSAELDLGLYFKTLINGHSNIAQ